MTGKNRCSTHDPSEGEDAEGDLGNVPALEEVGRLEDLLVRNAVLPDRRLEPGEEQNGLGWVGHCIRFRLHDCHNRRNAHVSIDTFPLFPITSIDASALSPSSCTAGRRAANKASPPLIDGGCPASE